MLRAYGSGRGLRARLRRRNARHQRPTSAGISCDGPGRSIMRCPFRAALGVVCISAAQASAADLREQVEGYGIAHAAETVCRLADLTRIRSVAADPAGIATAADRLQASLTERGFEAMQLSAEPGTPPLVFGELRSPGAKHTVVF